MKKKNKAYNTVSINRIIFIIVTSAILLQGSLWLADSVYLFRLDMEKINQIQTEYIKTELKERVDSVLDYTDYRSQEIETILKEELHSRTYEAYLLMNNIYENNKDTKSKEEITEIIKDALREIRFNDGRGYFFIDTLEADVILYPVYPDNEGKNLINLQDANGNYILKEEIQLVRSKGEGYIEGYWKNPSAGDDKTYKKITFVKAFEPYGWYLGCGDYVNEITKEIQKEIMTYVNSIQYGEDNAQYVFIHDYSGVELANGVYPEMIGINNYELEDINGAKVLQDQIKICIEENGGYLTHYWPREDRGGHYKKISYVAPLHKWEWVIGTGVDISKLDQLIDEQTNQLRIFIWQRVFVILLVLGILISISMFSVKKFMSKVKKNFDIFRDYMISAKIKLVTIDVDSLDYVDFSELAEVTNSMTERINQLLHFDELTGIYNRRHIMEIFDNILSDSANEAGIILADIDFFKKVNDNFGHDVGDETLVIIASLIKMHVTNIGSVGRFGGEEFVVILPYMSLEETAEVADKIRKNIESHYIESIDGYVTISCGVAHSLNWQKKELFKQADNKLYLAKKLGRNRVEF